MFRSLKNLVIIIPALLVAGCAADGGSSGSADSIIPRPASVEYGSGNFTLAPGFGITPYAEEFEPAARYLADALYALSPVVSGEGGSVGLHYDPAMADGAYRLEVARRGITLTAGSYGGIVSAAASLVQMLPANPDPGQRYTLNRVVIEDSPRFGWRGFMLDCSRHFWTKEEVLGILDLMAMYKLNKFHWHITDDEGWRMETDSYPLLTERGAWRNPYTHRNDIECARRAVEEDNVDFLLPEDRLRVAGANTLYGGFYSKDDIREVVAYAALRGIDVVPEVDMPGHSLMAIDNYPWLSCFGRAEWGQTFSTPLCLGKDSTLEFCRNVWSEVFELFPYEYMNLGADEVEKDNWKRCPHCQKRMKDEGLRDEFELQAWFVARMQEFFAANGRRLIGWDEVLYGGVSPETTVNWWRAWKKEAPGMAAANGNRIIVCPTEWFYLDYDQSRITLNKTYNFELVPGEFSDEQRGLILGVQGNLWCENIPTIERVQNMIFPRLFAVSELGWTQPQMKDEAGFNARVPEHYRRLDRLGVHYRIPDLDGVYDRNVFVDTARMNITCPHGDVTIRWSDDGKFPTASSPAVDGIFCVAGSKPGLMFRAFRPDGSAGEIVRAPVFQTDYAAAAEGVTPVEDGIDARWFDYRGESVTGIDTRPLRGEYLVDRITIPEGVTGNIGLVLTGYLDIPADGIYTFRLASDDGSTLRIGDRLVVDNDGPHSMREKTGQAALRKGLHAFEVRYFDYNGGGLSMGMVDDKGHRTEIDREWFKRVAK